MNPRTGASARWRFLFGLTALLLLTSARVGAADDAGFQVEVRLTGTMDYPGIVLLSADGQTIDNLCLLGQEAKGNVDTRFLRWLEQSGIPEGDYGVAGPVAGERWPVAEFVRADALRLEIRVNESTLLKSGRHGIAIHGRDFFPLLMPVIRDKKMIQFYDGQLFQRLGQHWGPLRLSNWDMDRLFDFWQRHTQSPGQWTAHVKRTDPEPVRAKCKPPVVKRQMEEEKR